jgi:hypothetical protein
MPQQWNMFVHMSQNGGGMASLIVLTYCDKANVESIRDYLCLDRLYGNKRKFIFAVNEYW